MELFWLVPIVFGAVVLVLAVIFLAVLIPAARRQVARELERQRREPPDA